MSKFLKRLGQAAGLGFLSFCLIIFPFAGAMILMSGCNVNADVTLIGTLAESLFNSCAAMSLSPNDVAVCTAAASSIKVGVAAFQVCTTSYDKVKGQGGSVLAAFSECLSSTLTGIQTTLAGFHVTNSQSQNIVIIGMQGIIDVIDIIATYYGVATPVQLSRLEARRPGLTLRISKWHANSFHAWRDSRKAKAEGIKNWNDNFCAKLTGAAAIKACEVH